MEQAETNLILIRGVSGAGKSTIGKLFDDGATTKVLSTDDMFVSGGFYRFDASMLGEYHAATVKKVKEIIAQELVKELKLNEVKPFIDPKLKSKPNDRIQYVATNDHRYPSEIAFIDTQKGEVVFFNIQQKEVERISWNKLNSTHWVRDYIAKEFEGFLDGHSPSGKIHYQGADKTNQPDPKDLSMINKARAKAAL